MDHKCVISGLTWCWTGTQSLGNTVVYQLSHSTSPFCYFRQFWVEQVLSNLGRRCRRQWGHHDAGIASPVCALSPQDAKYHMQRCIDSGLWVPNSKSGEAKEGEEAGPGDPLLEAVPKAGNEKDISA